MPLIISDAHKAIVAPPLPGVLQLFPTFPRLKDGKVVIPHGMRETLLLRHQGFDVPNPLARHYQWGFEPFKAQVATFKLLTEHTHAYVLNDMGTGKTFTSLSAWDALNKAGLAGKLLVVAPLSTLHIVWKREAFKALPPRRLQVLHGTRKERLLALADQTADIYVINHDGVKTIEAELLARTDITALILDELAVYRNNSGRSKRMRGFARRFQTVWGMTGTPMPNEPVDVWAQAKIVTPHTVPKYQRAARDMLMTQVAPYKWVPKPDAIQNAFKMLQPSVRFTLDDVVELPELVKRTIDIELSTELVDAYNKIRTLLSINLKGGTVTALNAGALLQKLVQIGGGWCYTQHPKYIQVDASERIEALRDLINSASKKVLVAVPFTHMLEGISKAFSGNNSIEHCVVHGGTSKPERDQIFTLFQHTDKFKCMLAHPATVYHGLTLTAADTVIWYVPIASLDVYDQFNARITRIGQKHRQQIIHLSGTPTDKKLYRLLLTKESAQDTLLELLEEATEEAI